MRATTLIILLVIALALPAAAQDCAPTTSQPDVDTRTPDEARFYVDLDLCMGVDCLHSVWIYQESNGIEGLQRGDEVHDDTCGGAVPHDAILF